MTQGAGAALPPQGALSGGMTDARPPLNDPSHDLPWLQDTAHRAFLTDDARRQLAFFDRSLRGDGGFDALAWDGSALPRGAQELHVTTRMVHSYVLAGRIGHPDAGRMVDAGMAHLWDRHRDAEHGGYVWGVAPDGGVGRGEKLAYGHVFVLLAASSATIAGHPDAGRLMDDIRAVIEARFWDEDAGRLREEFGRDWSRISGYRGMNANMHGVEGMLAAFEATGVRVWLDRARRVLAFFTDEVAAAWDWRIPEHYREDWSVDPDYAGDPMFRPKGTTPGHSLEWARLALQGWDLAGRPDDGTPDRARRLTLRALEDAWRDDGGLVYTLEGGAPARRERLWWPVTEGIGALAALLKIGGGEGVEEWYRPLWRHAAEAHVDRDRGGWYPAIDEDGRPTDGVFEGKPDLYHALQADLFPLVPGLSRQVEALGAV